MQAVVSDFITWFGRFVIVSTVFIIATHLLARSIRKRQAARKEKQPAGGMSRSVPASK